jgi:hypothetical protein
MGICWSKFPELTGDPEQLRKMKHIGFQAWIKPAVPRFRSCSSFNTQLHNIDLQKKLLCSNVLFVFPTQLQMLIIKGVPWQPVTINTTKSINNSDATARTSTTWKTCNSSKLQAFERRWRLKTKRTELKTQNISRTNGVARRSERNPRARVIIPLWLFSRVCENKANCKVILHYFIGFGLWRLDFFPSLCACTSTNMGWTAWPLLVSWLANINILFLIYHATSLTVMLQNIYIFILSHKLNNIL